MTKQLRYPMESFALAMVFFGSGLKEASIVGIGIIFAVVLQSVIRENMAKYSASISTFGGMIGVVAIYIMLSFVGIEPSVKQLAALAVMIVLFVKNDERMQQYEDFDYNNLLIQNACAYGIYMLFTAVREYFGTAKIFGFELEKVTAVSKSYTKPMMALIVAAIAIAVVNRILKVSVDQKAGMLVCIPVICIETPFVWNNVNEVVGTLVGVIFGLVIYVSLRKKLTLADTRKHIQGVPVELAMLGIIYMVFSFL